MKFTLMILSEIIKMMMMNKNSLFLLLIFTFLLSCKEKEKEISSEQKKDSLNVNLTEILQDKMSKTIILFLAISLFSCNNLQKKNCLATLEVVKILLRKVIPKLKKY